VHGRASPSDLRCSLLLSALSQISLSSCEQRDTQEQRQEDDARPARVIPSIPRPTARITTGMYSCPGWVRARSYGYQVQGPFDPSSGMRFDRDKLLLDPYGRGVMVLGNYSRQAACSSGDNVATAMQSVVVDPHDYDWEGRCPTEAANLAEDRLRNACARVHAPPEFRRAGADARHLSRPNRKEQDRSRYANYSRTGNTLNANHPVVRRMIVDSLRYWVEEMHVDGFGSISRPSSSAIHRVD